MAGVVVIQYDDRDIQKPWSSIVAGRRMIGSGSRSSVAPRLRDFLLQVSPARERDLYCRVPHVNLAASYHRRSSGTLILKLKLFPVSKARK